MRRIAHSIYFNRFIVLTIMITGSQSLVTMTASKRCCMGRAEMVEWRWPNFQYLPFLNLSVQSGGIHLCNTFELLEPSSLSISPVFERQRWIIDVTKMRLYYTGSETLGPIPKGLGLNAFWRLFVSSAQLGFNLPTVWSTSQASSNRAPPHPTSE